MKFSYICSKNDNLNYNIFKAIGIKICRLDDLEKTDEVILKLLNEKYNTILLSNEVASFSEDLIKKYRKSDNIKIIITP